MFLCDSFLYADSPLSFVLTPNFQSGSLNNIKSEDIQSFELAPGIEQTRAGTDASDSIDEALFRDSNAGYDLDLQGYNGNEMLDSNATDGLPKVPSISAPVARRKKALDLPKIIVETRDPSKYTLGGPFQNGKYIGKVLEIDYEKNELLVEVHKQRYSLSDTKAGRVTSKRTR